MSSENTQILRINLEGKHKTMFEDIKRENRLKTNTDAIRFCIETAYTSPFQEIPNELMDEVYSMLKHQKIRTGYCIYNREDFIKRAVSEFILKLRSERGSLRSFSTRMHFTPEENKVALAILDLSNFNKQSRIRGVSIEQLASKLKWTIEKVYTIMEKFKAMDYLIEQEIEDEKYYYAPYPEE